jgi:predicted small secreted protein
MSRKLSIRRKKMKKYGLFLAVLALVFASLACQTLNGGGEDTQPLPPAEGLDDSPSAPTESSSDDSDFSFDGDSEFPMPDDAKNVVSMSGTVNYQTGLGLEEVMDFYREIYGNQGYTERDLLTVVSDGVFSMVFDGDPSGQAIVIQGVDLGDGTVNVNIRLEDA